MQSMQFDKDKNSFVYSITAVVVKTIDSEVLDIMRKKEYMPASTDFERKIKNLIGSHFL